LDEAIAQQALAARCRGHRGSDETFRDDPATRLAFVAGRSVLDERSHSAVGRELPAEFFDLVLFTTGIIAAKTREETPETYRTRTWAIKLPEAASPSFRV